MRQVYWDECRKEICWILSCDDWWMSNLEVFASERVLQLDNFRRFIGFGWPGFRKMNLWRQDKG